MVNKYDSAHLRARQPNLYKFYDLVSAQINQPLIGQCDTSNLNWLLNTLLEEIYEEYLNEE